MGIVPFQSRDTRYKSVFGACAAGETVWFRLLLERGVRCHAAWLVVHRDDTFAHECIPMEWSAMDGAEREWWRIAYTPAEKGLYWYHFEYDTPWGRSRVYHIGDGTGAVGNGDGEWQLTVFSPSFSTPEWLKGGLIYQIFPDRFFCSGTPKQGVPQDRVLRGDWGGQPEWRPDANGKITNNDYFGGDLKGIEQKLEHLASLGVTCLYLNPIFSAHSNHRYNTADYASIDPLLGCEADFVSLCEQAKKTGIHVVLDGVFSHTGSDSIYFNREGRYGACGAYRDASSPYYEWYKFQSWPQSYDAWWGIDTLPEVREESPGFLNYITGSGGVVEKWLRLGADGWRLDVADELPDVFLDALRARVKQVKPDALVLGEVWEDASNKYSYGIRRRYLLGDQLDSVMNYPFASAVLVYVATGNADGFGNRINTILENYPPQAIHTLMNHIGTHDTARAITVLAGERENGRGREWASGKSLSQAEKARGVRLMKLASVLQYTLPGVPSLYYGDEIGMQGYGDPFNRGCFDWSQGDLELLDWYRQLGRLRKDYPVLKDGNFTELSSGLGCVAYARENENDCLVVIVNRNEEPMEFVFAPRFCGLRGVIGHSPEFDRVKIDALSCAVLSR